MTRQRRYPVVWADNARVDDLLWPQDKTWSSVMDSLRDLAATYGKKTIDDRWGICHRSLAIAFQSGQLTERMLAEFASQIHAAVRQIHYVSYARIARQRRREVADGSVERYIRVQWEGDSTSPAEQLRRLERATKSNSQYKFENCWRALKPPARAFLNEGLELARADKSFAEFKGDLHGTPVILSAPLPLPAYVSVILPYARKLCSASRASPDRQARDVALALIRRVFLDVTGRTSDAVTDLGHDVPDGAGADFVRQIEAIFESKLMSDASTHAIQRAREIDAEVLGFGSARLVHVR